MNKRMPVLSNKSDIICYFLLRYNADKNLCLMLTILVLFHCSMFVLRY